MIDFQKTFGYSKIVGLFILAVAWSRADQRFDWLRNKRIVWICLYGVCSLHRYNIISVV